MSLFEDGFRDLRDAVFDALRPHLFQRTRKAAQQSLKIFDETLKIKIAAYASFNFYNGFDKVNSAELLKRYEAEWKKALDTFDGFSLEEKDLEGLNHLAIELIGRSFSSWFTTGFVISGFGRNEIFPSLRWLF